jgi:ribonuclease-3
MHLEEVEERLGYIFTNKELLFRALVHRSYVNENKEAGPPNERLEFLGDSVLGFFIADYLYHRLPNHPEGQLSALRSRLVDANSCAQALQKLGLQESILLGRGEKMTEGKNKTSILADAFEAVVGAIYLDGGWGMAKSFLLCHLEATIQEVIGSPPRNYKAELQEYAQKKFHKAPVYQVIQESGPDHAKIFHVMVYINEQEAGLGIGASKKEAESRAAFEALSKLV